MTPERTTLLLSVQRALSGLVPSSLRAVACGWNENEIILRFVFDGPIDAEDEENMRVVGSEVIADFPAPVTMEKEIVRADRPSKLEEYALQYWVFIRKESANPSKGH